MNGSWRRRVVVVATTLVLVQAAMVFTDMGPRLLLVTSVGLFVAAALWMLADVDEVAVRPAPLQPPPPPPSAVGNLRITALRQGLASSERDSQMARQLHARLLDLVDDALAARGIDRRADVTAATRTMGPELSRFVAGDGALPRTPAELGRIVTLIEAL